MENNKIKILAIDDNNDNLISLKAMIQDTFPEAIMLTATSGKKGIEIAANANPDVILLDIVMPEMDGFEVCQKLKADKNSCDIPVIFVTALKGDRDSRIRALDVGAEAFLAKPIDISELTAQIRAMTKIKYANTQKRTENERLNILVEHQIRELREKQSETLKLLETITNENEARKKSESALRESEEKTRRIGQHYQAIIEKAPDGFVLINSEGQFKFASPSARKMFGYGLSDELTESPHKYTHPDDLPFVISELTKIFENPTYIPTIQYRFSDKNGNWRWIESTFSNLLADPSVESIVINFRDITERKHAEKELHKLSRVVEQSPTSIVITDIDGKIEYVNPKLLEITGYKLDEVIGKSPQIFSSGEKPKSDYKIIWDTILSGKEWRGEFHNKKKNGELYWESATLSPLLNEKDIITNYIAVKEDITEKKRMINELIIAKEKAEEMNRVKSSFFSNMSHELRTPMIGILGFSEILEDELKENKELTRMANTIRLGGQRLMKTLNLILDISKLESGEIQANIEKINIVPLLKEAADLFASAAERKELLYVFNTSREEILCKIDSGLFEIIFENILNNAVKFTDNGSITMSAFTLDAKAVIEIADTGIGISDEEQKLIWEEFRQASEGLSRHYEGTGLGLTIAKKYTELMGGTISVHSAIDKGTRFTIKFPLSEPKNIY